MSHLGCGINRCQLDQLLRNLGGSVNTLDRTGEIQYSHPAIDERPRADGRRQDAPRHLVQSDSCSRRLDRLAHREGIVARL